MQFQRLQNSLILVIAVLLCLEVSVLYFQWQEDIEQVPIPQPEIKIGYSFWKDGRYLWRPNSVNYSDGVPLTSDYDRVGDQLSWTKQLFEKNGYLPTKNILLVFGNEGKEFWGTGNEAFCPGFTIEKSKCNLTKFSGDLSLNLSKFDAVVYTQDGRRMKLPDGVQEFIYASETPIYASYELKAHTLWISFYRGSDIVIPYYKWVAFSEKNAKIYSSSPNLLLLPLENDSTKDFSLGKPNFAVAITSHCNTASNREGFIKELQKYVSVDVFGDCGTAPPCNDSDIKSLSCTQSVARKYKFYLAFENSNCRDYITEKLFKNALMSDVLPVVMGAHPDDYLISAPPNSYIHVEDFKSPKELADYLTVLDKNDTLYNQYFKWKGTGVIYLSFSDLFCRVCGMVFYNDYVSPRHTWPDGTTWASINKCLPNGQWYWNEH